nr:cytochrome P450 [Tanacetum cinerariifolium]
MCRETPVISAGFRRTHQYAASEILKTHDQALSGRDVSVLLQKKEPTIHNMSLVSTSECDDRWRYFRNIYKTDLLSGKALESTVNILGNATMSTDLVDYEGNGIGAGIMDAVRRLIMLFTQPQLADLFPILGQWDIQSWYKKVMHIIDHELGGIWVNSLQRKRNETNISSSPKDFVDLLIEKGFTNQQINPLMEVFSLPLFKSRLF